MDKCVRFVCACCVLCTRACRVAAVMLSCAHIVCSARVLVSVYVLCMAQCAATGVFARPSSISVCVCGPHVLAYRVCAVCACACAFVVCAVCAAYLVCAVYMLLAVCAVSLHAIASIRSYFCRSIRNPVSFIILFLYWFADYSSPVRICRVACGFSHCRYCRADFLNVVRIIPTIVRISLLLRGFYYRSCGLFSTFVDYSIRMRIF